MYKKTNTYRTMRSTKSEIIKMVSTCIQLHICKLEKTNPINLIVSLVEYG